MEISLATRLPVELFRGIIEPLVVISATFHDVLKLRLVSRSWNTEVLRAVSTQDVMSERRINTVSWVTPWYATCDFERRDDSLTEFWTSYILANPLPNKPWNCNLATLLTRVLDEVLTRQGGPHDLDTRRRFLRILMDEVTLELGTPGIGTSRYMHRRILPRIGLEIYLRPERTERITEAPLEGHVLIAQLLLGHREPCLQALESDSKHLGKVQGTRPLGTVLRAAVTSGSVDLARQFLGVPAFRSISSKHRLLQKGVETGDLEMVQLVMEPPGREAHRTSRPTFDLGVVEAIARRHDNITQYLLSKADPENDHLFLVHEGVRAAAHTADNSTLTWLLAQAKKYNLIWTLDCCETPLEIAAREGNLSTMRILLGHGVDPKGKRQWRGPRDLRERIFRLYPHHHYYRVHENARKWLLKSGGAMFTAATQGRIDVAELLLENGLKMLEDEIVIMMMAVVELQQMDFFRWALDKIPRWTGSKCRSSHSIGKFGSGRPDLLGHVCVWGTPEMLKMLVERGYSPDGKHFAEGHEYDNIILATLNWSRPDMRQALLDLGAQPADPYESNFKLLWERGRFPRKAKTKVHMVRHVEIDAELAPLYHFM